MGLGSLEELNLQNLPILERFDSTTLSNQTMLKLLKIETWPQIEKFRLRLASVLSKIPSLKILHVKIREDILSDQLIGGLSHSLKELWITGELLRIITPESLDELEGSRHFVLSISQTSVDSLPQSLMRKLTNIKQLTLDIRHNKFTTLSLEQCYNKSSGWENKGTNIISGK